MRPMVSSHTCFLHVEKYDYSDLSCHGSRPSNAYMLVIVVECHVLLVYLLDIVY